MSNKAFAALVVVFVLIGGALGGAFVGGHELGIRDGKQQVAEAARNGQSALTGQTTQNTQTGQARDSIQATLQARRGQSQGTPGPEATPSQGGVGAVGQPGAGFTAFGAGTSGTVQKVDGSTVTIDTGNGATLQVALSADTTIEKTAAGTSADLKAGTRVTVLGQRDASGVVQARAVVIVPEGAALPGFLGGAGGSGPVPGATSAPGSGPFPGGGRRSQATATPAPAQ